MIFKETAIKTSTKTLEIFHGLVGFITITFYRIGSNLHPVHSVATVTEEIHSSTKGKERIKILCYNYCQAVSLRSQGSIHAKHM